MKKLVKGDRCVVLSPAGKVDENRIKNNCKLLVDWGLQIEYSKYCFDSFNKFSSSDENRLSDLQTALDNPNIKAIICSRGGYGLIRLIDHLNFDKFIQNPKWIIGFSDITVLHNHLNNLEIKTIHAPMPNTYSDNSYESIESLKKAIFDDNYQINLPINGKIVGGNLSIIYSLIGSNSELITDDKFLFIEDVSEHLYNIDRMMWSLKRAGKLDKIKGLLVGSFDEIKGQDFGQSLIEIIENVCMDFDFPIYFNIPSGHCEDNHAIIFS